MAAELRHPATGNPIEVGEGEALWRIDWLGDPVLVVTKTGPDSNALYRLADPRCKTWNRVGYLKLAPWPDAPLMLGPRGVDASAGPITLPVSAALSALRCWLWGDSVFVLPLVQFSMSPDSQRSTKRDGGEGCHASWHPSPPIQPLGHSLARLAINHERLPGCMGRPLAMQPQPADSAIGS